MTSEGIDGGGAVDLPASHASIGLPADRASAGDARRFVVETLGAWDLAHLCEPAELLVSELVTNVILHARTPLGVLLLRIEGRVRIEVHDGVGRAPTPRHYADEAGTGRGLLLLDHLAVAWGADRKRVGKVVWFELDTEPSAAGGEPALEVAAPDIDPDDLEALAALEAELTGGMTDDPGPPAQRSVHDRLAVGAPRR